MGAGREVWVKIRASEAERGRWHAKTLSHTAIPGGIAQSVLMVVSLRDTKF